MMKFGSLFSGIGGFDLGFERAGMECAWQCEIDAPAQEVLQKHFGKEKYNDVKTITKGNSTPVDVICGGFPCQDVSVAGRRAGLAGERSGLWHEFHRIVTEHLPRWVVIENIPGLLSSNEGKDFAVIIQGLVECGYRVAWRILDSQYFGVPQRRRRVFIVGSFGDGRAAEVLFERESMQRDFETSGYAWNRNSYNVARSITTNEGQRHKVDQETYIVSKVDDGRKDRPNGGMYINEIDKGNGISSKSQILINEIAWTVRGGGGQGGKGYLGNYNQAMTLGGQPQWVGVRRLTPVECARLQGFPDDWNDWLSDTQRYKQFGNAVTVNVAEWIGNRIRKQV